MVDFLKSVDSSHHVFIEQLEVSSRVNLLSRAIRPKTGGFRLSYVLILLGIAIMVIGSGTTLMPMSTIEFDSVKVTDVPTFSATLIFVGIVILAFGATLYVKGK